MTALGNLCQCVVFHIMKKYVLVFRFSMFQFVALPLVLSQGTAEKSLLHPSYTFLQLFRYIDEIALSLLSSRLNSPSLKLSWDIGCTIKNQLSDKISSANHCNKNYILGCFDSETIMEKGLFCSSLHILKYCSQLLKTVQFWAVCTMLLQHLIMYFCTYVSLSGKHLFLD